MQGTEERVCVCVCVIQQIQTNDEFVYLRLPPSTSVHAAFEFAAPGAKIHPNVMIHTEKDQKLNMIVWHAQAFIENYHVWKRTSSFEGGSSAGLTGRWLRTVNISGDSLEPQLWKVLWSISETQIQPVLQYKYTKA